MEHATAESTRIDGYASALVEIARAEGAESVVPDEFHTAAHGLAGNSELIETLRDPRVPTERKQGIVNDLLGSRASAVTVAAINFVIAAGQSRHLTDIAKRFAELSAEAEGEVVAEVRAPMPLAPDQVERLQAALARATNRRVQVKVVVDPTVVGGLVTKVGDTVLDGSIQGRFNELREQWG
jgi:F-type H+-transporting ATPase subunit delta